ncbi:hypothetical protein J8273_8786 [Carpediemonas membranifera]|uniref:Uncharacterized protein n=1 Tax=Carpediemonas membranifera TaxID=201153 RepID=A0A8J6AX63_9EUKA|nr:hypothetical protein J8273_8786 [Carpediemonas membranifera]|eukprot:KAG9389494.1 hypothetical protein J8273_8786 [Carpediemonas membranifera]
MVSSVQLEELAHSSALLANNFPASIAWQFDEMLLADGSPKAFRDFAVLISRSEEYPFVYSFFMNRFPMPDATIFDDLLTILDSAAIAPVDTAVILNISDAPQADEPRGQAAIGRLEAALETLRPVCMALALCAHLAPIPLKGDAMGALEIAAHVMLRHSATLRVVTLEAASVGRKRAKPDSPPTIASLLAAYIPADIEDVTPYLMLTPPSAIQVSLLLLKVGQDSATLSLCQSQVWHQDAESTIARNVIQYRALVALGDVDAAAACVHTAMVVLDTLEQPSEMVHTLFPAVPRDTSTADMLLELVHTAAASFSAAGSTLAMESTLFCGLGLHHFTSSHTDRLWALLATHCIKPTVRAFRTAFMAVSVIADTQIAKDLARLVAGALLDAKRADLVVELPWGDLVDAVDAAIATRASAPCDDASTSPALILAAFRAHHGDMVGAAQALHAITTDDPAQNARAAAAAATFLATAGEDASFRYAGVGPMPAHGPHPVVPETAAISQRALASAAEARTAREWKLRTQATVWSTGVESSDSATAYLVEEGRFDDALTVCKLASKPLGPVVWALGHAAAVHAATEELPVSPLSVAPVEDGARVHMDTLAECVWLLETVLAEGHDHDSALEGILVGLEAAQHPDAVDVARRGGLLAGIVEQCCRHNLGESLLIMVEQRFYSLAFECFESFSGVGVAPLTFIALMESQRDSGVEDVYAGNVQVPDFIR